MLTLWHGILSNNAAKVRILLAEKNLPYEAHNLNWTRKDAWGEKPAEFLAVSPRGEVPVLIDDDLVVHDSTVINEYLEDRYPEPPLFPGEPRLRAKCRIWEDEADFQQKHVAVLIRDVFRGEPGTPLTADAMAAQEALTTFFERVDEALGESEYLCGDFSVADISVFMTIAFAITLGVPVTQPNLERWYATMLARPSVKTDFEAMMTAAAAS